MRGAPTSRSGLEGIRPRAFYEKVDGAAYASSPSQRAIRQALLRLLRHRRVPLDRFDVVRAYLRVPHALSGLCDDIVHSAWVAGPSPNSIQPDWILQRPPTIKPMHKAADTRPEDFKEDEDDRVEYTLDELAEIAETLRENPESLFNYAREVGLIDRGMDF